MARLAAKLRQMGDGLEALPKMGREGRIRADIRSPSGVPDFEYALIDGTIVKVHRHGGGAKGGLKIRLSASRAAA